MRVRIPPIALCLALLPGVTFGQSPLNAPITTTLCELLEEPALFNGKIVQFRAEFVSKFQWEGFVDETCSAKLQIGVYHPLDNLTPEQGQYAFTKTADDNEHPERLNWKPIPRTPPVHLKQDGDYKAFRNYADSKFRWPDGGICQDCALYRVTMTATGRFDHFESDTVAVSGNPPTITAQYSAYLNAPLSRFVLQSVSDVATTPIVPSVYTEAKGRDLSLEETNDLVTTFLKGRGTTRAPGFQLVPYDDNQYYPEFQFFQAIFANPNPIGSFNLGHYAVDRKTGDVWDAVRCDHLTSRSLTKLQSAIRQRIGLTQEAYRKLQRDGPMCEPGMPRLGTGK